MIKNSHSSFLVQLKRQKMWCRDNSSDLFNRISEWVFDPFFRFYIKEDWILSPEHKKYWNGKEWFRNWFLTISVTRWPEGYFSSLAIYNNHDNMPSSIKNAKVGTFCQILKSHTKNYPKTCNLPNLVTLLTTVLRKGQKAKLKMSF